MEQGREIGELARTLHPEGILVDSAAGATAIEETKRLMADSAVTVLFEPAFQAGQLTTKADILTRTAGGWHLIEVKSSFSDTDSLKDLIKDVSYTAMVLGLCGVSVEHVSLLLLSRDYRYGDPPSSLFCDVDVTDEALGQAAELQQTRQEMETSMLAAQLPEAKLGSACRSCDYFKTDCLGKGIPHTVLELPAVSLKKLSADRIVAMEDVPLTFKLNERQKRAKEAAISGNTWVNPLLKGALDTVKWPCHYLDFETIATFLPLYPGGACHEQILTQFSIHHRSSADGELSHSEYLVVDPQRNCELELAEKLISALGSDGSILVYTEFERKRIEELMAKFSGLRDALSGILQRLVDLHPIVRDNIYHPEFRGSFSIKKVLPALVKDPELSYQNLQIADGGSAVTAFARMARGEITGQAAEETRANLLRYCKLDTLAMVRLHELLLERAGMAIGA
jgi:hypothetical protein